MFYAFFEAVLRQVLATRGVREVLMLFLECNAAIPWKHHRPASARAGTSKGLSLRGSAGSWGLVTSDSGLHPGQTCKTRKTAARRKLHGILPNKPLKNKRSIFRVRCQSSSAMPCPTCRTCATAKWPDSRPGTNRIDLQMHKAGHVRDLRRRISASISLSDPPPRWWRGSSTLPGCFWSGST